MSDERTTGERLLADCRDASEVDHLRKLTDMIDLDGGGYGRNLAEYDRAAIAWLVLQRADLRTALSKAEALRDEWATASSRFSAQLDEAKKKADRDRAAHFDRVGAWTKAAGLADWGRLGDWINESRMYREDYDALEKRAHAAEALLRDALSSRRAVMDDRDSRHAADERIKDALEASLHEAIGRAEKAEAGEREQRERAQTILLRAHAQLDAETAGTQRMIERAEAAEASLAEALSSASLLRAALAKAEAERDENARQCRLWADSDAALTARVRALEEAAKATVRDLREHVADGECAGPDGDRRRGACSECRIAQHLERALVAGEGTEEGA